MAEETTHNEAGEQAPSTVDQQAPSVSEENAPATSEPTSTDIPTANKPDPEAVNSGANPEAVLNKNPKKAIAEKTAADRAEGEAKDAEATEKAKPAAKAKKEKPPALEDKPFADFIQQDYLPALKAGLTKLGVQDLDLTFEKRKVDVIGFSQLPDSWQVVGRWNPS